MNDIFTILEVANMLNITTQAVYKRLQQDKETLDQYLTTKGGKKSLTKDGVIFLCDLMGINNPFEEAENKVSEAEELQKDESQATKELLQYLKEDNQRLAKEILELKAELQHSRLLREEDKKTADEERRQHEEARMRSDALLMRTLLNQQKTPLLERLFKRKPKNDNAEEQIKGFDL